MIQNWNTVYCLLYHASEEGAGSYDINRFFAVQNYKSTADQAQLIRCPSPFPHPFSEEPSQLPWGEIE